VLGIAVSPEQLARDRDFVSYIFAGTLLTRSVNLSLQHF
jgi:hypothetical protein